MSAIPIGASNWYYGAEARFYDSDNSNFAGFKANATTTADVTYTWPASPPAVNGYVMQCTTAGVMSWGAAGAGTVTSVAATVPTFMSVSGSAITTSGTLGFTFNNQSGYKFLASPNDGSSGAVSMRAMVTDDLPDVIRVRAGASSSDARVGGILFNSTTAASDNTGGGVEVDFHAFTVPASTLDDDGDGLEFFFSGSEITGTLSKTLKAYIDGNLVFTSSGLTTTGAWELTIFIIKNGSNSIRYSVEFSGYLGSVSVVQTSNGVLTPTLTSSFVVKTSHTTVLTGATPYATEYFALCDFIPSP